MTTENPTTEAVETPVQVADVTETPVEETFDKERAMATITKLRESEKQSKQERKELEQLRVDKKQREDAALTESERHKKERDELALENAKIKSDLLRRDVIDETGLPAIFADRLKGDSKEELLADAEAIAKTLPQLKVAPKVPATNPNQAQTIETDTQKRERLFGRQGNPFDMDAIKEKGGGVIYKT